MSFIVTPLVTFIVFMSIYSLFELFVRRRERMAIIEKLGDKLDPAYQLKMPQSYKNTVLMCFNVEIR